MLEIAAHWYIDDLPVYVTGTQAMQCNAMQCNAMQQDTETFLWRWKDLVDHGYGCIENACFASPATRRSSGKHVAFSGSTGDLRRRFPAIADLGARREPDAVLAREGIMYLYDVRDLGAPPVSFGWH